jgi:hypothetical protein
MKITLDGSVGKASQEYNLPFKNKILLNTIIL